MNVIQQAPVLIVVIPLVSALIITIVGVYRPQWVYGLSVLALVGSAWAAIKTSSIVATTGPISYHLSGWRPPIGIAYNVDHLNSIVLVTVAVVAALVAIYSKDSVTKELGEKSTHFYVLFLLLVAGLLGITITGDAFNLYVLLEISALTSYGLLALGKKRAYMATFNYVMMGTIGACFYLLGVGYLLIKTGTLNMINIGSLLPSMMGSQAILLAFVFIMIGMWVKMAFFPLHGWLPNAYSYAPTATSCLVAPLMTKVSVYVMIRVMFTVFSADYVFRLLQWQNVIIWLSVIAILVGSFSALAQTRLKRMLTYIIVAEIGYMVGGIWLGNMAGIVGATYHIIADALMTACLFMAVGCIIYKLGDDKIDKLSGIFKKMPLTMVGFVIGAFSMIGIPPTAGFFSKWYLLTGAFQGKHYEFLIALLISSLVNAILFFRIFEVGFFGAKGHDVAHEETKIDEAPIRMVIPVLVIAIAIIILGCQTNSIISVFIQHVVPESLS